MIVDKKSVVLGYVIGVAAATLTMVCVGCQKPPRYDGPPCPPIPICEQTGGTWVAETCQCECPEGTEFLPNWGCGHE